MKKNLKIGIHKDGVVALDMEKSVNQHVAIIGRSGSGKSVAGQKIIKEIVKDGRRPVVVFDTHNLFADDNIFPPFSEEIKRHENEIDAISGGISMPLFTPMENQKGKKEDMSDVVMFLTDIIGSSLKLGCRQRDCLFQAAEFVAEANSYAKYGIAALDKALGMADDDKAAEVQGKLRGIFRKNIFQDGPAFIENGKINVVRLSSLPEVTQALAVEISLNFIWRMANSGSFINDGLCIFLDECQNMDWGKNGIVNKILSEGRKMGLQLVLITQILGGSGRDNISRCMMQAGSQLYFLPAENEVGMISKLIGAKRNFYWQMALKSLTVGECVVKGSLLINGTPVTGAVKLKILDGDKSESPHLYEANRQVGERKRQEVQVILQEERGQTK